MGNTRSHLYPRHTFEDINDINVFLGNKSDIIEYYVCTKEYCSLCDCAVNEDSVITVDCEGEGDVGHVYHTICMEALIKYVNIYNTFKCIKCKKA